MTDLMRYAAELEDVSKRGAPPVDKWNPDYCGELDLVIKRDGVWIHEGTPIGRARLVRLFSTILKREGEKHFLVTPVEKLGIKVEDAPFLAVLLDIIGSGRNQRLNFTTNVGDIVTAGPDHRLQFRTESGEGRPYLDVRRGLEALVARSVYYALVEVAEHHHMNGQELFGVWSDSVFFPFGPSADVFGAED
ncbi:MAG: DUF1285 domain-containing protein [Pseudomonadota bacterium]